MKKAICLALMLTLTAGLLSGCWDYRGLDAMTIVAGIAVDQNEEDPELYTMTFEIIDVNSSSGQDVRPELVESHGRTIVEAVHNSSRRLYNEMYFGNTEIMIVSRQLAEKKGINEILDAVLRDFSTRDTMSVLIAETDTAKEILNPENYPGAIISYSINSSIMQDNQIVNSVAIQSLYNIYDKLTLGTQALTLPMITLQEQGGEPRLSTGGMAVFREDRMESVLTEEALPAYMLVTRELSGGCFTFVLEPLEEREPPLLVTLEVIDSSPKIGCRMEGEQLVLEAGLQATTGVAEITPDLKNHGSGAIKELEQRAEEALSLQIRHLVEELQKGSGSDVLGFGDAVYRKDPKLWARLETDWEQQFRDAPLEVQCSVTINDTGLIKKYRRGGI